MASNFEGIVDIVINKTCISGCYCLMINKLNIAVIVESSRNININFEGQQSYTGHVLVKISYWNPISREVKIFVYHIKHRML